MLVLSRKTEQTIQIGDDVQITVLKVKGNQVRLGISAPNDVRVIRGELVVELDNAEELGESLQPKTNSASTPAAKDLAKDAVAVFETGQGDPASFKIEPASDQGKKKTSSSSEPRRFQGTINRIADLFPPAAYQAHSMRIKVDSDNDVAKSGADKQAAKNSKVASNQHRS